MVMPLRKADLLSPRQKLSPRRLYFAYGHCYHEIGLRHHIHTTSRWVLYLTIPFSLCVRPHSLIWWRESAVGRKEVPRRLSMLYFRFNSAIHQLPIIEQANKQRRGVAKRTKRCRSEATDKRRASVSQYTCHLFNSS